MKKSVLSIAFAAMAATVMAAPLDGKKVAIFIDGATVDAVANNQEKVPAQWLLANGDLAFTVTTDNLAELTPEKAEALWVHVDRCDIPGGSANLPAPFNNEAFVSALKGYVQAGGNLLLSKHATQLATAIGRIDKEANQFSSPQGGEGADTWTVQNVYGVTTAEPLDRSTHVIYKDLVTVNDFNNVPTVALLGTGNPETTMWREDHNCFWIPADLGFGDGNGSSACITEFEAAYNCLCLGAWGHVTDYCGAGIIDFAPTAEFKGRVITIGLAAYEWAPRNGGNGFHSNIEGMTVNALNYLAPTTAGIDAVAVDTDAPAVYYNLQGVRVENPTAGSLYIVRQGNRTFKTVK